MDWNKIENLRGPYYRRYGNATNRYFKHIGEKIAKVDTDSQALFRLEATAIIDNGGMYKVIESNNQLIVDYFGRMAYNELVSQKSFNIFNFGLIELLRNRAFDTAVKIDATSKYFMGRLIDKSIEEGLSVPKIADLVGGFFKTSKKRALRIARTETVGASNMGSFEGAKQTGLELDKYWIATRDKKTRPTHKKADGQIVKMNERFRVGRAYLLYPGDKDGPAEEIINCRCAVGYKEAKK
jgi:hypothetical protein